MFPCACSLRSPQCAALIALAAAAGIARVDQVQAAGTPAVPQTQQIDLLDPGHRRLASHFDATNAASAPWLRLIEVVHELLAERGEVAVAASPADGAPPHFVKSPPRGCPSAREHSFPFAVGPPPVGVATNARADDTLVSGDSAARRTSVSCFAPDQLSSFFAHNLRDPGKVRLATTWRFKPDYALRGEPEGLLSSIRSHHRPASPAVSAAARLDLS